MAAATGGWARFFCLWAVLLLLVAFFVLSWRARRADAALAAPAEALLFCSRERHRYRPCAWEGEADAGSEAPLRVLILAYSAGARTPNPRWREEWHTWRAYMPPTRPGVEFDFRFLECPEDSPKDDDFVFADPHCVDPWYHLKTLAALEHFEGGFDFVVRPNLAMCICWSKCIELLRYMRSRGLQYAGDATHDWGPCGHLIIYGRELQRRLARAPRVPTEECCEDVHLGRLAQELYGPPDCYIKVDHESARRGPGAVLAAACKPETAFLRLKELQGVTHRGLWDLLQDLGPWRVHHHS